MTDDERLLEIATRLMAGALGSDSTIADAAYYILKAEQLLDAWRERTGAREERGQDVSDELLNECKQLAGSTGEHSLFFSLDRIMEARTERARAAGKGESNG